MQKYKSDLTNQEWNFIKHLFDVGKYGNRRKHSKRELVNAVFYITKTGCQWHMLPNDFPPYKTVFSFYSRAKSSGIWDELLEHLVAHSRQKSGRKAQPTFALIDSRSVKTTNAAKERGIDGGKG